MKFLAIRAIVALAILLTLAGTLFTQVKPAAAWPGDVWSTRPIYYGQYGNGGAARWQLYGGRSGFIRFWYRNRGNPGNWYAQNMPVAGCATVSGCNMADYSHPPMYDSWNWLIDHADLISSDNLNYGGGHIVDAGPNP